ASPNECLCAPCGTCGPSMGNVVICSPTKWCSIDALAESVGNWLFYIALAIVPLMVVISGAMLLSSSGNPEKVNKAKDMLIWTMVGVGVMFISKILYVIIKSALGVT
ncbi:pilin, partial [Patescibacteria group bacterium]|nr:pilin [Patescibacteria group bacterium]